MTREPAHGAREGARERDGAGAGAGHGENLLGVDGGGGSYASESESGNVSLVEGGRKGVEKPGVCEEYWQVLSWSVG